jgi:hypothetical protein
MQIFASTAKDEHTSRTRTARSTVEPKVERRDPVTTFSWPTIFRKAACSCGGDCPACQASSRNLRISQPNDPAEIEADQVADRVMRMPVDNAKPKSNFLNTSITIHRKCDACEEEQEEEAETPVMRKEAFASATPPPDDTPPSIKNVINSGGQPLDLETRNFFEPRFRMDLSHVRIHSDSAAGQSARSINARAYTLGSNVVFGHGQYRAESESGRHLMAHELTHVLQQRGAASAQGVIQRDMYTEAERRTMSEGRVTGTAADIEIATRCNFQPGDIVFRMGSRELASRIGEPVTHGGIYLGDGLVHDMVGFGNRNVRLVDFYNEAADQNVVRIVRFTGPLANIIVPRVVSNIRARRFDLPTDPVPWNLFSSATDYRTATCLEYSHAQFLFAIRQIHNESFWSPEVLAELDRTYFRGAATPAPLIQPRQLMVEGAMGIAVNERRLLISAADYLAEDVDPNVFQNRWEGRETLRNVGTAWAPTFWQQQILESFTYRSFVDARQFFTPVDCAAGPGAVVDRYRAQVLPIGPARSENRTDPVDRTVTTQTGIAWARHADGHSYLVLMTTENSSIGSGTNIQFVQFVDESLRERAISRAQRFQPRGIQSVPWSAIRGIPDRPGASVARQ